MAFIIKNYNKYDSWDRAHAKYIFEINGQLYAIMEVILFWGLPQLPLNINEDEDPKTYRLYDTYDNAFEFVKQIKHLNK